MASEIKAILIFEMLGRPAEHLKSTLGTFIEKISEEDGVKILNKKVNEPKRLDKAKQELFTTFSEVEIEFKDLDAFFKVIFVYMPSHIEIIHPNRLDMDSYNFNSLVNEIIRRLHQYDEIAKKMIIERNILQAQLQQQGISPAVPSLLQRPKQSVKGPQKDVEKKAKNKKTRKNKRES